MSARCLEYLDVSRHQEHRLFYDVVDQTRFRLLYIEWRLVNANNHPKLRERRFLNATLIYFKISIANVAIALCHGGVPTRMARSVMVGPLFSLYLYYVPYLCMYVKVTSVESRAVGLTLRRTS